MHMIKQEVKKKNPQSDLIQQIVCLKETDLVLRIEGNDLTHTAKTNVNSDFGSHTISQNNTMDTQRVKFSVRYTFNAAQSKYRGSGAGSEQKSRM